MQVMKLREVCSKVRKSKSGLYLSMKKGDFPKPIQLGEKSVGWLESEIDDWIAEKAKEREVA